MRKGKLVEQGSHEELLQIQDGVYHGLVYAQALAMDEDDEKADSVVLHKEKTVEAITDRRSESVDSRPTSREEPQWKEKGFLASGGLMIAEQRNHVIPYLVALLGILGAGAVYPIQAYVFAVRTFLENLEYSAN